MSKEPSSSNRLSGSLEPGWASVGKRSSHYFPASEIRSLCKFELRLYGFTPTPEPGPFPCTRCAQELAKLRNAPQQTELKL